MLLPTYVIYAGVLGLLLLLPAVGIFCIYNEKCSKRGQPEEPKEISSSDQRVILVMPVDEVDDTISSYDDLPPPYDELFPSAL